MVERWCYKGLDILSLYKYYIIKIVKDYKDKKQQSK
jgi:hypothetical protein